jgi:hypothetical protein
MKKSIVFLGSLLIAFGLKAQTTKPAKKETTKPATTTASVSPKPANFTKASVTTQVKPLDKTRPLRTSPVTQIKAVPPGKRH